MDMLTLDINSVGMTDEQYFQLCRANRDLRFERSAKGELIIMPPAGGKSGGRNFRLTQQLANWTDTNDLGTGFDSSTGFKLPNGADRSPDAAWVRLERWKALTAEEQDRFVPLCPDFVAELRSKTDSIKGLRLKMQEYLDNGAQLGWLIDPQARKVEIYRPGLPVEVLDNPERLSGEPVLPGFVLNLAPIWA
ncbi:Uma2 family endonuclease [Gloeobacter morelensis MG652769]|uniref:Uma2 family endonuclease n=2 Tax=Gloeobacter TaxID=33071 RepID=A0ABY3PIF8_9CYAN|nr:Uma2 family endonuclease [Gloeobacter morelensis MG652769]